MKMVVGTAASLNIKSTIREILGIKQAVDRTKMVFGHQVDSLDHESSLDGECLSTVTKPLCRA
jgi:hypothetical protein